MTAPELTGSDMVRRLHGEQHLTAADFNLEPTAYQNLVDLWVELASEREGVSLQQRRAHVRVLALKAVIQILIGEDDKFRAEGSITTEKNVMARVNLLQGWLKDAETEAGLVAPVTPVAQVGQANPEPEFAEWGLR
ncbi:hypothetical protein [Deinococcus multiflagellatus]|uniref:Terminase n=1 Tax=Deinococcus multiflagellatus TaxID=1656887 RepID=A0ABW1ZRJ5_9DEIO|nr:hypothetical protein [Deinococcus multiflagellatus]MBZ9715279.1 hypothetical protein [Deinococcus multiflagellatus]